MPIKVPCPYCDHVNRFADNLEGKRARCKACDEMIDVPFADEPDDLPPIRKGAGRKAGAAKGMPVLVWVLIGLGGVLLLGCGCGGVVFYFMNTNERLIVGKWQATGAGAGRTLEFEKAGVVRFFGPDGQQTDPATYRFLDSQTMELTWASPWDRHSARFKFKVGWSELTLTDERGKVETFTRR